MQHKLFCTKHAYNHSLLASLFLGKYFSHVFMQTFLNVLQAFTYRNKTLCLQYTNRCRRFACVSTWTVKVTIVNPLHISHYKFYTRPHEIVHVKSNMSFWVVFSSLQNEVQKRSFNIKKHNQYEDMCFTNLIFYLPLGETCWFSSTMIFKLQVFKIND
jgi:uncharacterized membrane protein